jgi:hypothetical protein
VVSKKPLTKGNADEALEKLPKLAIPSTLPFIVDRTFAICTQSLPRDCCTSWSGVVPTAVVICCACAKKLNNIALNKKICSWFFKG